MPPEAAVVMQEPVEEPRSVPVQETPIPEQKKAAAGGDSQFWMQLVPQLRPAVGPAAYPFFSNPKMTSGQLEEDVLTLYVSDAFVRSMVEKPKLIQKVSEVATGRRGSPVQVKVVTGKPPVAAVQKPAPGAAELAATADHFADLVAFGRKSGMKID